MVKDFPYSLAYMYENVIRRTYEVSLGLSVYSKVYHCVSVPHQLRENWNLSASYKSVSQTRESGCWSWVMFPATHSLPIHSFWMPCRCVSPTDVYWIMRPLYDTSHGRCVPERWVPEPFYDAWSAPAPCPHSAQLFDCFAGSYLMTYEYLKSSVKGQMIRGHIAHGTYQTRDVRASSLLRPDCFRQRRCLRLLKTKLFANLSWVCKKIVGAHTVSKSPVSWMNFF